MNSTLFSFLVFVFLITGCATNKKGGNNKEPEEKRDSVFEQKFISDEYGFSAYIPPEWKSEVFEIGNNQIVINLFPVNLPDSIDFPLTIHKNAGISYISIFPMGYGTELPSGKSRSIEKLKEKPVTFEANRNESLAFFLENGQEWGYFIVPSSPPTNWNQHGFIFAQAAVNDFTIKCFDPNPGEELEISECDPLTGDSLVRFGEVEQQDLQILKRILNSFKFKKINNEQQPKSAGESKGIEVTTPQSGAVINSPLKISGKATGSWFFEALIEVELHKNGNTLASATGKAKGNWMTQDYVDFSATLNFPEVKETGRAELVFRSSNSSGKKELEKSFKVPVTIGK